MATVFLNGSFLSEREARCSVLDAGLQHGVGLFETFLGGVTSGGEAWAHQLDRHLDRMVASAGELGLAERLRAPALYDAVMETIARAALPRARVRLTITGGGLNLLQRRAGEGGGVPGAHEPTVLVVAQPAANYPEAMFERGVMVLVADARANPFNPFEGHKTLNYWWRLRELQRAGAKGAGEAIVLQMSNHLAGGCVSNVFVVKGGRLMAPIARGEEGGADPDGHRAAGALPSPVLPGVTRGSIIDLAALRSIEVDRRMLGIGDLLDADEVFLTNSSWGVLPVAAVEGRPIARGTPGEITRELLGAWRAMLDPG